MKFRVCHTFRKIDASTYEKLYFDESFNRDLCRVTKLNRTVLQRTITNGVIDRVSRFIPERELPRPIVKILGNNQLEYTEHVTYEMGSFVAHFEIESGALSDKINTYGVYRFEAVEEGVQRVVDGVIEVHIFAVGGVVERLVVADIEKSYDLAAEFTQRYIDSHDGPLNPSWM